MNKDRKGKVLITGASGNLGAKLARVLLQQPDCTGVIGVDSVPAPAELLGFNNFTALQLCLADLPSALEDAVAQADVVVHFAAQNPHTDATWQDASVSFDMTAHLLALSAKHCSRFVFASSNHVMGGYKDLPEASISGSLSPDVPPLPGTAVDIQGRPTSSVIYATAKLMGERLCAVTSDVSGLETVSLRIGWCLPSPNDPGAISAFGTIKSDLVDGSEGTARNLKWFRDMWLSDRDFSGILLAAVLGDAQRWQRKAIVVNAMSANTGMPWNLDDTEHLLGYRSVDDLYTRIATTTHTLFAGSYTQSLAHVDAQGNGIRALGFNSTKGALSSAGGEYPALNPSWLVSDSAAGRLYSVRETDASNGAAVDCWSYDRSGALVHLESVPSMGNGPCHLALTSDGSRLFVSNFLSGSMAVYLLAEQADGPPRGVLHQYKGGEVVADSLKSSNIHMVLPSPDGRYLVVFDAGRDALMVYDVYDISSERALPIQTVKSEPGSFPRHGVFSADGNTLYVVHESGAYIGCYRFRQGQLKQAGTVSTLAEGAPLEAGSCAAIRLHPNERWLYVSNRGENTIAGFDLADPHRLEPIGRWSVQGKQPRDFVISPCARFMLIANQDSHCIVTYSLDPHTGQLGEITDRFVTGSPVCLHFIEH